LLDFYGKFREYLPNKFWIAGESYAGKYIPDLAVKVDHYNEQGGSNKIDFRGVFVGNGVISFRDRRLYNHKMTYDIDHYFTDPDLIEYWRFSCQSDPFSAGCRFFEIRALENTFELNQYSMLWAM
jgi:carboxypeptidase C (cathepsin A)